MNVHPPAARGPVNAPLRLVVVSAGLGEPSSSRLLADRLAAATAHRLAGVGTDVDLRVVELRELAADITSAMLTGFADERLDDVLTALGSADGAIAVTPVFNAAYSGLFKSFFDVCDPRALTGLPVLIGATGGTERHSLALEHVIRPLFGYLHAVTVPTAVYAATSDWGSAGGSGELPHRIERAAGELAREMTRPDRDSVGRAPDAFALPAGFDPSGAAG